MLVNNNEKLVILKQVLTMTVDMHNRVESESWDELIDLEKYRQTLLDSVFPLESSDDQLKVLTQQILDLNIVIVAKCNSAKGELQQQLTGMNKNKRAMNAYLIT